MNAPKDNNFNTVLMGIYCVDGVTPIPIAVDGSNQVVTDSVSTISVAATQAAKDENYRSTLMAVSSVDGITPVPIYVNINGGVLVSP